MVMHIIHKSWIVNDLKNAKYLGALLSRRKWTLQDSSHGPDSQPVSPWSHIYPWGLVATGREFESTCDHLASSLEKLNSQLMLWEERISVQPVFSECCVFTITLKTNSYFFTQRKI